MDDRRTVLNDPQDFLAATSADRERWLRAIGLGRYGFLTQLAPTEANAIGVARFLNHPDRVKFPDLRGTDLTGLDLAGVNFIRGKLDDANLSGCDLRDADLIFASFRRANLNGADLRGATLDRTLWTDSQVEGCNLRETRGLTQHQREELRQRGAIVD